VTSHPGGGLGGRSALGRPAVLYAPGADRLCFFGHRSVSCNADFTSSRSLTERSFFGAVARRWHALLVLPTMRAEYSRIRGSAPRIHCISCGAVHDDPLRVRTSRDSRCGLLRLAGPSEHITVLYHAAAPRGDCRVHMQAEDAGEDVRYLFSALGLLPLPYYRRQP
jgi:hypothetical protein